MKNTYTQTNDINAAATAAAQRPWWTVRGSLLATLGAVGLVLAALVSPTPLAKWVFGEGAVTLASR